MYRVEWSREGCLLGSIFTEKRLEYIPEEKIIDNFRGGGVKIRRDIKLGGICYGRQEKLF